MCSLGEVKLRPPREIHPKEIPESFQYLASTTAEARVNIRHPGYTVDFDLLFSLHTPDHASGGVHYGLVLDACAVIADNRRDGWLSSDREGASRLEIALDEVLKEGDYWYNIPGEDPKWPVVPSFRDWKFPGTLPAPWRRAPKPRRPANTTSPSTYSSAILARDLFCRISANYTGAQVAHICPLGESEWFFANGMSRFNNDTSLTQYSLLDDHANLILLRADIHKAFDDGKFILYPKDSKGFSLHTLEPTPDIGLLYHNAMTHPIVYCRPEFLYARFAWSLFRFISGFLAMPVDRKVVIVKRSSEQTRAVETWKSLEIQRHITFSRSRSPRKRERSAIDREAQDEDIVCTRARYHSETRPDADATIPLLEIDTDTALQQPLESPIHEADSAEKRRIHSLREAHLKMQRPEGYMESMRNPFEGTADARTVFKQLGFEIVEDDDC